MFGLPEKKWFEKADEPVKNAGFAARILARGEAPVVAIGTAVSPSGIAFLVREPLKRKEIEMRMVLREKPLTVRVLVERSDKVTVKNEILDRHYGRFTGIGADDWDLVVRYVKDLPEPTTQTAVEAVHDEEFRLLPRSVRDQIVRKLVEKKRLAQPEPGSEPLLRFRSEGIVKNSGGRTIRKMIVESRHVVEGIRRNYSSHIAYYPESGFVEITN